MFRLLARRSLLTAVMVFLPLVSTLTTTLAPAAAAVTCADLIVTDITVTPSSPVVNQTANIDVTVKNQGSCTATGFVVQWKSSQTAPTGPSGSVASLGAGSSTTLNFTYAFPTAGNFLTSATADTANAVPESVENNNEAIKSVTVQQATTDLVITNVTFTPDPAVQTDTMHANIHIVNQGNTAAGSFRVSWLPGLFSPVQSQQVNSLGAGQSTDVGFDFTYWASGMNLTIATVDSLNNVQETNELNNTFIKMLTVDPPLPDLTIQNVSISPAVPIAGQPAQLTVTIQNIGHRPAGAFQVQWQPTWFTWPMQKQVNGPIPVGGTTNVTFNFTYPFSGSFAGTIKADVNNWVWEVNENNNTSQYQVGVGASNIDLTITDFHYTPANPVQGEDTTFSVTIKNQGNTTANNFVVSVNPQAFVIFTPGPSTLTTNIASLAPGASQTLTFHYQYPVYGNFRAIAQVDDFNNVAESNEANNTALANLVVSPANIDLRIDNVVLTTDLCAQSVPASCSPMKFWKDSAVTAAITVHNYGTYPADSFSVQWLLHDADVFGPIGSLNGLLPGQSQTIYLTSSYPTDSSAAPGGTFTSKAIVDVFNQVVEPCSGCENNNTYTTSPFTVLPRDTTVAVAITQFHVFNDLDDGSKGEWNMLLAALNLSATCHVDPFGGFDVPSIQCANFYKNPDGAGDQGAGPTISITLPEYMPLVIAITGCEDDSPDVVGTTCIPFDFPGYALQLWLPGDYQVAGSTVLAGQGGDSRCSGGECFYANVSVSVTAGPPPPASVGSSASTPTVQDAQTQMMDFINTIQNGGPAAP